MCSSAPKHLVGEYSNTACLRVLAIYTGYRHSYAPYPLDLYTTLTRVSLYGVKSGDFVLYQKPKVPKIVLSLLRYRTRIPLFGPRIQGPANFIMMGLHYAIPNQGLNRHIRLDQV